MTDALVDGILSRIRTVLTILAVSIVAGTLAYITIPKEADPDIPIPFVLVQIPHPGISPEDGERLLIKPMEKRLQTIEGVQEIVSSAVENLAYVVLEFDVNFDQDQAILDVREQVDLAKSDLPEDTEEPIVTELNAGLFPIVAIGIGGNLPERELYRIGERLQDKLEAIPNVLEANLSGNREELLEVVIDPVKLETYNITQQELINAVVLNNQLVPAGSLDTGQGRFSIKVPGTFETAADVFSLPLKSSGEGVVTLSDVAEIRRTFKDRDRYARFNGKPAVVVEVVKRIGANIIETNLAVRAVVEEEEEYWPEGVEVGFVFDQSRFIYSILGQLQASILTAVALVMVIVVAALGIRSGLMVGFAIPASFILSFLILFGIGSSVNMMTMFAMVIAVGILVDGSIVVVEYADRKMAEGLHRKEAYAMAAKRMFWPIVTSTLTTLAAFFPLLFWPGVSGKFMSYLPITLIIVLTASFLMALFFLPAIGAVLGRTQVENADNLRAVAAGSGKDEDKDDALGRDLAGMTGAYVRFVEKALDRPLLVTGISALLVFSVIQIFARADVGTAYFVDNEPENIAIFVGAIGNYSTDEALDIVLEVEKEVMKIEGLNSVYTSIGSGQQQFTGFDNPPPDDTIGTINVELKDWTSRPLSGYEVMARLRELSDDFPGVRVEVRENEMGPQVGKDVQIELRSRDQEILVAEARRVRQYMDEQDYLIEIEDTSPLPGIEWKIIPDREQAGRFGADVSQIGAYVQLVTQGLKLGEYRPDDAEDEVEIRVRYPAEDRSIDQLNQIRIRTPQGLIPMSNFVTKVPQPLVKKIDRLDGQRVFRIRANSAEGVLTSKAVANLEQWMEESAELDPRVSYRFRGADEESEAAAEFQRIAMLVSLFLMAIILLTQFNNYYFVVLTLSSIVLSTTGVFLGVVVTGQVFSTMMTGVGIIALAGIVVNNNIVLIDTFQRLSKAGYALKEAIVRTAAQRVRPVLLTTVTTVCGLFPMAMKINLDFFSRSVSTGGPVSDWWVPLSTAVIFGLMFSTMITLILTPCLLMLPNHCSRIIRRLMGRGGLGGLRGRIPGRSQDAPPQTPQVPAE